MVFEVMRVNGIAEPSTIFKVKTCLQFNCGYLHCLKEKTKHSWVSLGSDFTFDLLLSSHTLCLAEFPWTKLESQRLQRFVVLLSENVKLLFLTVVVLCFVLTYFMLLDDLCKAVQCSLTPAALVLSERRWSNDVAELSPEAVGSLCHRPSSMFPFFLF